MISLNELPTWKALSKHAETFTRPEFHLSELVRSRSTRFSEFSVGQGDLLLDYSKNYLTEDTLPLLLELAEDRELSAAISAMFRGDLINNTEQRPALHVALRQPADGCAHPEVEETLKRIEEFVTAVRNGQWAGYTGKPLKAVVNIGIGGSDLGPVMVSDALAEFADDKLDVRFASNVDPVHLARTIADLDPETTLFIIASKSFSTLETHQNAAAARRWFLAHSDDEEAIAQHFVAITTNLEAAASFGIPQENLFPMWDWVGGRYSLWSAIGLPIALGLGMDNFRQLLAGAHAMDEHFRTSDLAENMPVIMALLTVWYTGFFHAHSTAIVPYSQPLNLFPTYLQQLYMESLGKRVDRDGEAVQTNTGEVVWGTAGTNGQHSYFQLFHQGREFIPVDFIAVANASVSGNAEAHQHLLANCLSQSLALMDGTPDESDPHKQVPGSRPSNTLLMSQLTPYTLGGLIALYEHKVYAQSVIWGVNAFDQWGVELGKKLSKTLFSAMNAPEPPADLDSSTRGLITTIKHMAD